MNKKETVRTLATIPCISRSDIQSGISKDRPRMKIGSQQGSITPRIGLE